MERSTRLDLPLVLPEVKDLQDECVVRLLRLLERRDGVVRAHVVRSGDSAPEGNEPCSPEDSPAPTGPRLCLHYDPERLSLTQLTELAKLAGASVTDRFGHALVPIRAVGSEDDGLRLEATLRKIPGVTAATVNLAGQVARIEYDKRRVKLGAIERELREAGATPTEARRPEPAAAADASAEAGSWYRRNRELVWSLTSGALLTAGWLVEHAGGRPPASLAPYLAAYFFGARDNVGHFLKDLRRGRLHFNIDLLMVVAAVGAAILGEWVEGALLLFLFSLGHALEHYALGRARNAIKALAELAPSRAIVLRDGRETTVRIEAVRPGDRVVVKPAERIPVDGTVGEGKSSVNQAPITGESMPVAKAAGDPVYAGSVNGEGALVIAVTAAIGDRTLDRVIKLVAEAETQKAPTQQFTDRFERVFVPLVLMADALLIVLPPLLGLWTWSESFYRGMALLVAASPCALALGTPAAVLAGIAQAARKGVLIKGGAHLETLGMIQILALDKTGTITKGEPAVTDLVPASGVGKEELLRTTAAVEQRSQHPLARAILNAASARSLELPKFGDIASVTGQGIRGTADGRTIEVGRLLMFEDAGKDPVPSPLRDAVMQLEQAGRTTVVVRSTASAAEGGWLGVIGIADEPRRNAKETLGRLRAAGIKRLVMLTGDNAGVGTAIGQAVGVDEVRAGLLPEDKVTAIRELAASGRVAMVGDGVNDAPALANASVGIAMGGAGTAAALETADVALMGDDLARLPFAIGLSRRARSVIKQNLFISLGVIALLIAATVAGFVGIGPAVVVHEGSTLVVIANALRLLAFTGDA
ncbi:MAG: heavy metal translocating P-type ATPase [Gemmatimonadales bacterium]